MFSVKEQDFWLLKIKWLSVTASCTHQWGQSTGLTHNYRIKSVCGAFTLDFSPEGDTVEDDEQNEASGSEWTFKHLFDWQQALQAEPKKYIYNYIKKNILISNNKRITHN